MTCFLHFPTKIYGHAVYVSHSFSGWREFVNIPVGILENVDTLPEVAEDEKGVVGARMLRCEEFDIAARSLSLSIRFSDSEFDSSTYLLTSVPFAFNVVHDDRLSTMDP
jgi:hypothetical protein